MRKEKLKELKTYIDELKTIKMEKIDKINNFIKTEVYECNLNNGESIIREKIIKGNLDGSAAIILPITKDNNVVLIVESRVFTKRTVAVSIPAGYIEKNEESSISALRELKEEIGYDSKKLISLGGFYQDMGCSEAFNECFIALDCEKVDYQNLDDSEYIRYFECTFEEALELIEMNYIQDGNTIITLEKAKTYMKGR